MRYEIITKGKIKNDGGYDVDSLLGKIVRFPVVVKRFTYRVRQDGIFQDKTFGTYRFPDTSLIDITMQKNIVTTVIQGRTGTVKELVSNGDYRVRIRGVLTGEGVNYPFEEVGKLKLLADIPAAFPVSGWLFGTLGINSLVVESLSFPVVEGQVNAQSFVLDCISDNQPSIELLGQFEGL